MKKTYINPALEVIEIGIQQMLCGSTLSLGELNGLADEDKLNIDADGLDDLDEFR